MLTCWLDTRFSDFRLEKILVRSLSLILVEALSFTPACWLVRCDEGSRLFCAAFLFPLSVGWVLFAFVLPLFGSAAALVFGLDVSAPCFDWSGFWPRCFA